MAPTERFDVVVIGGGQAGLAAGYHLAHRRLHFVIVDAYPRVGEAWRKRWSSLRLFTPARLDALPGMPFPASPGTLPTKEEMAAYLEQYVERQKLPVRNGVRVDALTRDGARYVLVSGDRRFEADQVVVATGGHPVPRWPDFATGLDPEIVQLHSADYRDPSQLQEGNVLVAGAGNSGAEIAMDVAKNHTVYLAGRPTGQVSPVVYSPPLWWMANKVLTVKTQMGRRMAEAARKKGTPLVRLRAKDLAAAGITRVPRVAGVDAGMPRLEDGLRLHVRNVIWCTGFKHDYSWIKLPSTAGGQLPEHERGVVASQPGLYFVGLPFQFGASSALVDGVGRDAAFVADRVAAARTQNKVLEVDHV